MPTWLFIGPSLLSGIGQVTNRYAQLIKGEYVQIGQTPENEEYDVGFAFVLPIEPHLNSVDKLMTRCKKKV